MCHGMTICDVRGSEVIADMNLVLWCRLELHSVIGLPTHTHMIGKMTGRTFSMGNRNVPE